MEVRGINGRKMNVRDLVSSGRVILTGIISVSLTLSAGNFAGAQEGKQAVKTEQTTKMAQGNRQNNASKDFGEREFGFVKGKTTLEEAIRVLKERGVSNIVTATDTVTGYTLLLADGFRDALQFFNGIYGGIQRVPLIGISPLSKPSHYAIAITEIKGAPGFNFFVTAENLFAEYDGRVYPVLAMTTYQIPSSVTDFEKNITKYIHGTFFDLSKIIEYEGGFKEPKLVYHPKENLVILIAKDNNGNWWNNAYAWDAKTFEPLGHAPTKDVFDMP